MDKNDAEEYTQSLGQICSGSWRQIALAKRLGVPQALGLKTEQWVQRLGGYIKQTPQERYEAVLQLNSEGESNTTIAEVLGVNEITVRRDLNSTNVESPFAKRKKIEDSASSRSTNVEPIDAIAALAADEKVRNAAKIAETRKAKEEKNKADLARPVKVKLSEGLHHGDFRDLSSGISDASVDLIFTDPPYDKGSIDLYGDAARVAKRILKPGGSFIAYSGQKYLPDVYSECSPYLDYWWTIAGVHAGSKQIMNKLGVRCGWKPLVWFVKGTRGDVANVLSDVVSGGREKTEHEWQQSEEEARYYIEKLTTIDGTIVDFFVGSGTTAAAAKRLKRKWIGFENNAATVERMVSRK